MNVSSLRLQHTIICLFKRTAGQASNTVNRLALSCHVMSVMSCLSAAAAMKGGSESESSLSTVVIAIASQIAILADNRTQSHRFEKNNNRHSPSYYHLDFLDYIYAMTVGHIPQRLVSRLLSLFVEIYKNNIQKL